MTNNLPLFEQAEGGTPPPKKRKTLRNTLITLGVLVVVLGVGAAAVYGFVANMFNSVEKVSIEQDPSLERPKPVEVPKGQNAPINIMLLGADSREALDTNAAANSLDGFRSDVIMVAQVSPDRKNVTIMSIMRDNWVPIQGHGEAKINAAIAWGGVPLAVNTVENFIGARIDHIALIDFESFKGLTDAVGGVTVHNAEAFTSTHGKFTFAEGDITLNGAEALSFVRERYAFTDGDYQRVRNQQAFLKGLTQKILSSETLSSPSTVANTFNALKPYLIVDEAFDFNTAATLGYDMRSIRSDDIKMFTSPTVGTSRSPDGEQSIVMPNWLEMENVRAAVRDGRLHEYAQSLPARSELPESQR